MDLGLPCKNLCGHNLKRFHWSCFFCRHRRTIHDSKGFHRAYVLMQFQWHPKGPMVVPDDGYSYTLFIDKKRKHAHLKGIVLKKVLELAEFLAS